MPVIFHQLINVFIEQIKTHLFPHIQNIVHFYCFFKMTLNASQYMTLIYFLVQLIPRSFIKIWHYARDIIWSPEMDLLFTKALFFSGLYDAQWRHFIWKIESCVFPTNSPLQSSCFSAIPTNQKFHISAPNKHCLLRKKK